MLTGTDHGRGHEPRVVRLDSPKDDALLRARAAGLVVPEGRFVVEKYAGDSTDPADLYEVVEAAPNLFLTAGITALLKLAAGQAAAAWNAANTRLAVGDSTTAAAAAQTDLQASTNKYRQLVDAAPTVATNSITFVATFPTTVANFAWNEVGVVNAASGGDMWSRTVQALGTKSNAATWILNWSLSIS